MPRKTQVKDVQVNGDVVITGDITLDEEKITADDIRRWKAMDERLSVIEDRLSI